MPKVIIPAALSLTVFAASPALAQSAGGGGFDYGFLLMMALLFAVMYFLLIRPQQKRQKEHKAMIEGIRRGDTVVTAGGLIGKVTKVIDDNEAQVEIADGVRVRVVKSTLADIRGKGEPAPAAATQGKKAKSSKAANKNGEAEADEPAAGDKPAND